NKNRMFDKVRLCPEATDPNPSFPSTNNQPGTAFNCWGPGGQALTDPNDNPSNPTPQNGTGRKLMGSYMYNGYCLRSDPSGSDGTLDGEAKYNGEGTGAGLKRLWTPAVKERLEVALPCDRPWPTGRPKAASDRSTSPVP